MSLPFYVYERSEGREKLVATFLYSHDCAQYVDVRAYGGVRVKVNGRIVWNARRDTPPVIDDSMQRHEVMAKTMRERVQQHWVEYMVKVGYTQDADGKWVSPYGN